MKLEQSFEVAAPLERVWDALIDVEPRGALPARRGDRPRLGEDGTYRGSFTRASSGPTTAAYRGQLRMEEVDEAARRVGHARERPGQARPGHREGDAS